MKDGSSYDLTMMLFLVSCGFRIAGLMAIETVQDPDTSSHTIILHRAGQNPQFLSTDNRQGFWAGST